jgi:hypothetical protein
VKSCKDHGLKSYRHLSNDGVEETPPQGGSRNGFPRGKQNLTGEDIFIDLECCNVGFQHWHPTSVTHKGENLSGQADSGGLWGIARSLSAPIFSS